MVTGVETAGLILGSIPLILAGLEFYGKGIAVSKRYWKYREGIKSLVVELRTENTMCLNSINMLLIGVVRPKEMADFLADPCGAQWKDVKFDKKLMNRLGTTYGSYIGTIISMNSALGTFKQRLKLDASGKPQFHDQSAFKEHYKRLRFSLNKSDYDDVMRSIRAANLALYRMTTQTISLENLYNASAKTTRQAMPKFQSIHDRAEGFYSALSSGWKCPCHADHSVNLRLESRMEEMSSDDNSDSEDESMQDPFHVLFRYSQHHVKEPNAPVTSPWIWEEADVRITLEEKRSPPSQICPPRGAKGVRFAAQAKKAVRAALDPHPNLQPIQDLCAAISTLQKPQRDVCLPLLVTEYAKQKYGILIYPHKDPPIDPESWSVSSLRQILRDSKFTRQDRLRLAVTLASSVLQLHETPWLEDWGKGNIFFIERSGSILYNHPFVSQHVNQGAQASQSSPIPTSMSRIIRNPTLFSLGVFLIELWYGKSLQELHKPEDGPISSGDLSADMRTQWYTADRIVDELYSDAGEKYSDAVRRCIRCNFDCRASSLDDVAFQKEVFQRVVSQLKENFDFLY
ncbi:uncharacterized protein BDZ99DRAFT_554877 [Mytilinidion resinicola]|uniref:DUF7580 domain-containing protein n=1 Tax=Mytilinidion resinicola TaxID=574789 RepID=A0A6A6YZU6_9PEZI|nr:uncharacterized protein BDZ99DRAFT_554877 [Mytilinidion resinicola]KAF2814361.1 hypothetical protein BDZ99DRAFT_554877 [Mytilinidion resinicola]